MEAFDGLFLCLTWFWAIYYNLCKLQNLSATTVR